MTDTASERIRIDAPADRCFDVAVDFESYPEWVRDVKEVKILEVDDEGRGLARRVPRRRARQEHPLRARVRLLRPRRATFSWHFVEGDMLRRLDGTYRFEPEGPTSTRVHYDLAVELAMPLPGPREAARRRPDHGQRAEGVEEAGRSRRLTRSELAWPRLELAGSLARPMRILLFTGKGGVGKTTVAAATAVRAAEAGLRTIVVSTDPAHSLADAFDVALDDRPTPIAHRLWGQQLNARVRFEEAWDDVRRYMVDVLDWVGADTLEAEELAVVPGLDEVFSLADIKQFATSGDYDLVVVDCAPTAETIRLLSLPDVLGWYMDRVFDAQRRLDRASRGRCCSRFSGHPDRRRPGVRRHPPLLRAARRRARAAHRRRHHERAARREPRAARRRRSAAHVHLPLAVRLPRRRRGREPHPADRARPSVARPVEGRAVGAPRVDRRRVRAAADAHRRARDRELLGVDDLRGVRRAISTATSTSSARLSHVEPFRVDAVGDSLVLSVHLPFTERDDVRLGRTDQELFVSVGPHRRALLLPDSLVRREVGGAHFEGDRLEVEFV